MNILPRRQTLRQFMGSVCSGDEALEGFDSVINGIAQGAWHIHQQIQKATLSGILGETGELNIQEEMVQKLDLLACTVFIENLIECGRVIAIGSEEKEEPIVNKSAGANSYIVEMDPIDGSSNIDVAVSVGSIFGIWRMRERELGNEVSLLLPGNEQVAAAYIIYGSSTMLVVATSASVNGFTLDTDSGTFVLTHESIRIPETCEYYSTNEGNFGKLSRRLQSVVTKMRNSYSLRYVGSLVADFHRNLLKGGIFLYLGDRKNPSGKLRLMYEANPLGFIAEQAGGAASNGEMRILDIEPQVLHQRVPLIIGNKAEVDAAVSIVTGCSK